MLQTAMIFNNKMVLQREKEIPVWGQAEPGRKVSVSFDGQTVTGKADEEGNWSVRLSAHEAGTGYELTITDGAETVRLQDVCVGEVWLAGGQSNMEYLLGFEKHIDEVLETEKNPLIRFFDYPEVSYEGQLQDFEYKHEGFWRGCTREDLPYFSAVGYYFAKNLQEKLQVPVGIVGCNWGGTPACAWLDPKRLAGTEGEIWIRDYEEAVKGLDVEAYKAAFRNNPMNDRTNQLHDPFGIKVMKIGLTREEQLAMAGMSGDEPAYMPVIGPYYERRPGGLYETMLKKLVPFALRGVIWYQGESDGDVHAEAYECVFEQLICNWRELWKEELPFLFVQLAPFREWLACTGKDYSIVRACQERVSKKVPQTWMASASDAGMEWDIHPKDKKLVGERLALLARGHVYGEKLLCDAPEAVKAARDGDAVIVSFACGKGLRIEGEQLQAMLVKTADGKLQEAVRAEVKEDQLILYGCGAAAELLFAAGDYYEVNLYNEQHIPAKPFILTVE